MARVPREIPPSPVRLAFLLAALPVMQYRSHLRNALRHRPFRRKHWLPMHLCDWAAVTTILALCFAYTSHSALYRWTRDCFGVHVFHSLLAVFNCRIALHKRRLTGSKFGANRSLEFQESAPRLHDPIPLTVLASPLLFPPVASSTLTLPRTLPRQRFRPPKRNIPQTAIQRNHILQRVREYVSRAQSGARRCRWKN